MLESTSQELVSELHDELGPDLRLVATYDPEAFDLLYARDDVAASPAADYEALQENPLSVHERHGAGGDVMRDGSLRARLLTFEEAVGATLLDGDRCGHVTTIESDAEADLRRYLRDAGAPVGTVRKSAPAGLQHPPAGRDCPRCGSATTIATPEAGPRSPYYCPTCDSSF